MALPSTSMCMNQWEAEGTQQNSAIPEVTFVTPSDVQNNILCVPVIATPPNPPTSETLCVLTPANLSTPIECLVCGQFNNETFPKPAQLVPFSQAPLAELVGISIEEARVCQGCAGLFQRADYYQMLANSLKQGLKTCADAKQMSQVLDHQVSGGSALACSMCPVKSADRRALSSHLGSHLQAGRLPCPCCGRSFTSWQTLRRHALAVHHGALLCRCRRCPAAFNTSAKLAAHKLLQHGAADSARRHRCPLCRRRFASGHRYAAHLRSHGAAAAGELRRTLAALAAGSPAGGPAAVTSSQTDHVDNGEGSGSPAVAEHDAEDAEEDSGEEWHDSGGEDSSADGLQREAGDVSRDTGTADENCAEVSTSSGAAVARESQTGFHCGQCDKVFKRKQSRDRHIGAVHKPSANLKCHQCGKTFSIKFYWQKHMNRHRDKQEQCPQCRRQFVNSRALKRHKCVAADLAELERPAPAAGASSSAGGDCASCLRRQAAGAVQENQPSSQGQSQLVTCSCRGANGPDTRAVSIADQSGLTCDTCGAEFATAALLSEHRLTHRPPRPHVCRTCGAVFSAAAALRKHSAQHRERSFQCSVCGKCFRWKNNLDIHARIHADERPYQCDICGHATRCSANLRLHKQRVHSSQRPHVCPTCQKAFKERYNLVIHQRSHTGERPYVCECCGHGFVTKGKLNSHMSKHSEQRPHECPLCLKPLKTPAILAKHCRQVHGVTAEEAAARAPPPPAAAAPLGHRPEAPQYLTEFVAK